MATYVFNVLKDLAANGYIHLDDSTRDGSTIVSDNTHNPLSSAVFRACLIQDGSSIANPSEGQGGAGLAINQVLCDTFSDLKECTAANYSAMHIGDEADNDWTTSTLTKVAGASGYTKWVVADLTITSVGAGQTIEGVLVVWDKDKTSTNLNTKVPLLYIGLDANLVTNGGNVTINWASTGVVQLA